MKCPKCNSNKTIKNGRRRGKQCYRCRDCGRQYVESPVTRSYPPEVKKLCLKLSQDVQSCFASQKAKKHYYDALWFSRIQEIKCHSN
ncbi:MAG: hypothetical protein WBM44_00780 [Waterburya sp.]